MVEHFSIRPKLLLADHQCGAPLLIFSWFFFSPKAAVGGASWRSPAAMPSIEKKVKPITSTHTHTFGPLVVMPCCVMLWCAVCCRVVFTKALRRPQTSRRRSLVRFGRATLGQKRYYPTDAHIASNNAFCNVRHRNTLHPDTTTHRNAPRHVTRASHRSTTHLSTENASRHRTKHHSRPGGSRNVSKTLGLVVI